VLIVRRMHDKAQVESLLCVLNWFIITVYFNCSIYKIKAICMYLDFFCNSCCVYVHNAFAVIAEIKDFGFLFIRDMTLFYWLMSGTDILIIHCHIIKEWNPQPHHHENLKTCNTPCLAVM